MYLCAWYLPVFKSEAVTILNPIETDEYGYGNNAAIEACVRQHLSVDFISRSQFQFVNDGSIEQGMAEYAFHLDYLDG